MDQVPYEFVDRVLTKLHRNELQSISEINLKAPIWMEAVRVYKEKHQLIDVLIFEDDNNGTLMYTIHNQDGSKQFTLIELLLSDSRFNRVSRLHIGREPRSDHSRSCLSVSELVKLLEHVFHFNLENLDLISQSEPRDSTDLLKALMENEVRTACLDVDCFRGAESFILKQLRSPHLTALHLETSNCSAHLSSELEAFVCRPQFKRLVCLGVDCFDNEALKRIVAYWRASKPMNRISSGRHRSSLFTCFSSPNGDEFDTWLTSRGKNTFYEEVGDLTLRVACCNTISGMTVLDLVSNVGRQKSSSNFAESIVCLD